MILINTFVFLEVFMKVSKQFSIVLAASVLAFGVATLAPQQADASYGYKYTDSQRPPVSTPKTQKYLSKS